MSSSPFVAQWGIIGCGCESTPAPTPTPTGAHLSCYLKTIPQHTTDPLTIPGISSEFVQDICRPLSIREAAAKLGLVPAPGDITHAVAAVGSRSVDKAREFRSKFCPRGAVGQQDGSVEWGVDAVGSYKEVVEHQVSILFIDGNSRVCS